MDSISVSKVLRPDEMKMVGIRWIRSEKRMWFTWVSIQMLRHQVLHFDDLNGYRLLLNDHSATPPVGTYFVY